MTPLIGSWCYHGATGYVSHTRLPSSEDFRNNLLPLVSFAHWREEPPPLLQRLLPRSNPSSRNSAQHLGERTRIGLRISGGHNRNVIGANGKLSEGSDIRCDDGQAIDHRLC